MAFGWISSLSGQEILFTNISNSLNLPSQECYNVIQDSNGYIWIATENGLVKYSKDNSKIFDKQNGLPENGVYFIEERKPGELILLTANNRFLCLKKDIIREEELTKMLQKELAIKLNENTFDTSYLINKDSKGNQIINTQQRTLLIEPKTSKIINLSVKNNYHSKAYLVIDKKENQSYFVKNNLKWLHKLQKGENKLDITVIGKKTAKKITINLLNNTSLDWRSRIINNKGFTFVSVHNNLIQIDENLNIKIIPFTSVIASLYINEKHGLWIGTSSNGVFHYPNYKKLDRFYHGLNGLTVSSILVDKEGSAWCTTTEKGVFYAANYSVLHYPEKKELNKKTTLLKTIDNQLFLSTGIDHLFRLKNEQLYSTKLLTTGNVDITDILVFNNQKYIATKGYFGILNNQYQVGKIIKTPKYNGNLTAYQLDSFGNEMYILGVGAIYKYSDGKMEMLSQSLLSKGRCFKVIDHDLIYVGCKDGLYKIRPLSNTQEKIKDINTAISKILLTKEGKVYFTTRGQGLNELVNDKAVYIPIKNASLVMNDLTQDSQGTIWIASNKGLIKYRKEKSNLYKKANGLLSDDITHLSIYQDKLFLSSPDGLCQFRIKTKLENQTPPLLQLSQLKVNNVVFNDTKPQITLKYWQKNLMITFDRLHYKSGNQECLEYKLIGQDTDFRRSNTNTVSFENLAPDNYELVVYAINNDGIKSNKAFHLNITIHPPFWKTAWFIILLLILLLCLIFLAIQKVIRSIQKKEAEKTRINKLISESQLSALQAQMNPHFIFNAINGIQNYILNKKEEEAYSYLTKFSQLVRLVLNNSRNKELTLQDELDMLALYIELEQLRFDHAFNYQLTIEPAVNPYEIEIPSLLIQPYVENAIWHGLMNLKKERNGQLNITVSTENSLLKIVIEDNGIGRAKANKFKTNSIHHSVGLQLTQERLDMIKNIRKTKEVKVEIRDVVNDAQEVCGTIVTLYLPLGE
jgi:ligand-binding sensor domain-containing protein